MRKYAICHKNSTDLSGSVDYKRWSFPVSSTDISLQAIAGPRRKSSVGSSHQSILTSNFQLVKFNFFAQYVHR